MAAALVIGAGLTLRSLQGLLRDDVGFTTTNRVSFKTNLTAQAYPDAARVAQFYDQAVRPARRHAGRAPPRRRFLRADERRRQRHRGRAGDAGRHAARTPVVRWSVVRGQYFETMGIALLRGRYFADSDAANAPLVAIVDDQLAQRWWQRAEAAIGQRVRVGSGDRTRCARSSGSSTA